MAGFQSRASFCASAICAGVILRSAMPRVLTALCSPCAADRLNHMWKRTQSCGTQDPPV
jgi:hypothetical protein